MPIIIDNDKMLDSMTAKDIISIPGPLVICDECGAKCTSDGYQTVRHDIVVLLPDDTKQYCKECIVKQVKTQLLDLEPHEGLQVNPIWGVKKK